MKATSDTTIDLLLRKLAQGNKHVSEAGEGRANEGLHNHLDPDEMNAFAENALPEAARARFASHLADCDSCRKLATELTMISSVAARVQPESVPGKSFLGSFGQMLAGFFSLPVLRFGVPALAILLLVIVAFVALRRPEGGEFIAQNEAGSAKRQERPSIAASPESSPNDAVAPTQKQPGEQTSASAAAATQAAKEKIEATDKNLDSPGYAGAANTMSTTQPGFAPEPKAPATERDEKSQNAPLAAAPAKPASSDTFKRAERADDSARKSSEPVIMQKDEQIGKQNREAGPAPTPKLRGLVTESKTKGPQRSREQSEPEGSSSGSAGARSSEVSVETRKVSGRTFRRQGNTWIDTAYNSSMTVTNLPRGSEQYRSFTEDDSGLRAIGEQLGNVIVVWKGKAYRIH